MLSQGDVLGPYEIVALVGQGGMATVYSAYHSRLDRHVAIKMMHQSLKQDPSFSARFEREARIIARLEHPNIIPIYDFDEHEGNPYLVMKFVEGQTLDKRLESGAIPLEDIVEMMDTVAGALTYAHEQGVLHRDIKPSNIVIDESGTPYLTDFGLARLLSGGTSTLSQGTMIGTPHYISPEQALGQSELDARTDVYSLGVVLYELVVGRVPFAGDTPFSIVHDHIYTPLPMPSEINAEVPSQVEAVLVRALAKDPNERYASAVELMAAFRQALAESNLIALNPDRAQPVTAPATRYQPVKDDSVQLNVDVQRDKRPRGRARRQKEFELNFGQFNVQDLERFGEEIGRRAESWAESVEEWAEQFEDDDKRRDRGRRRGKSRKPLTEEEKIRRRVEKRIEERQELRIHMVVYVMVHLLLWTIWLLSGRGFPWPLIVMFGWGIGMVAHYMDYQQKHGVGAARREREIERELEKARRQGRIPAEDAVFEQKAKRKNEDLADEHVRLAEDGELTSSFVDDLVDFEDDQQRGRLG
jgi:serine/threonine protein kinase